MSLDVLITGGSGYLGQFLLARLAAARASGAADANAAAGAAAPPSPPLIRRLAYTYLANPLPEEALKALPGEGGDNNNATIPGFRVDLADSPDGGRAALLLALQQGFGLGGGDQTGDPRRTVIVNCVAISTPATCERDYERARRVNVPEALMSAAAEAAKLAAATASADASANPSSSAPVPIIIHLSTDQVYPGEGRGTWREQGDPLAPENAYGRSKLEAEQHLQAAWPQGRHVSLRASLIYGSQAPLAPVPRPLFVQFVAGKLAEAFEAAAADGDAAAVPDPVPFFEDEYRSAVLADDIVGAVARMLRAIAREAADASDRQDSAPPSASSYRWPLPLAAYNMGGPDRLSRVDMALLVAGALGLGGNAAASRAILPVPSASVSAEKRGYASPRDISMDVSAIGRDVGVTLTRMKDALPLVLEEEARAVLGAVGAAAGAAAAREDK